MQTVSAAFLEKLRAKTKSLTRVVEIYASDAVPGADGFDPASSDLLIAFSSANVNFRGAEYKKLLLSTDKVRKKIGKELSDFSFRLSNLSREIVDFEYDTGFEGLICVVRTIDRRSSENLDASVVEFTGRCEKPDTFSRSSEDVSVTVKQILNQTEIQIPRRTFSPDDKKGRLPSDPLFEGFRITQRTGSFQYSVKKRFLLFFKKSVTRTKQYSSQSDFTAEQAVPVALGRVSAELIHLAYADTGSGIRGTGVWSDGEIKGFENIRSVTPGLPLDATADKFGKLGGTGEQINDDPGWIGSGIYSRSAYSRYYASGSALDIEDPAPDIVCILFGMKVPLPDGSGDFTEKDFSVNPVYQSRWLLADEDYFNLASDWFEDAEIIETANYCEQILVDRTNSELVLYNINQTGIAGTDYQNFQSTAAVSPDFFKAKADITLNKSAAFQEAEYNFYTNPPEIFDDTDGDGIPDFAAPPTGYRLRYTSNVLLSEQMSALDFLFDILFVTGNLYLTQKANGKIAIKTAKPADFSFIFALDAGGEGGDVGGELGSGENEILVRSIEAWKADDSGKILIGAYLPTSEVRSVTGWRYEDAFEPSISASGGVSSSDAALTDGSDTIAPNATLTVTSASGTKTVTIDGYVLTYAPKTGDTTATVAGMISALINSHPILTRYIKGSWTAGTNTVLVSSKVGYLSLDSPLEFSHNSEIENPSSSPTIAAASGGNLAAGTYKVGYSFETIEGETLVSPLSSVTLTANQKINVTSLGALPNARILRVNWYVSQEPNGIRVKRHSSNDGSAFSINLLPDLKSKLEPVENQTAEEVLRVQMAFADKGAANNSLNNSNILDGTFKFPLGKRQESTNQLSGKFRDASQDFKNTELIVNDYEHQQKVKKTNKKEINLAAVDSYNQARRLLNQELARRRDGDFFHGLSSDGEALLLEEGDVICVSDESGRFRNEPVRIEDVDSDAPDGYPSIDITARKYRRYFYDDQVQEKIVQLPVVINTQINTETAAPTIWQYAPATNTAVQISSNGYTAQAAYRKVQISASSDMSSPTETIITQFPMQQIFTATKAPSSGAQTKYIRIAHSSNNVTYSPWSNILSVTFANSGGTGGTGGGIDPCFTGKMQFRLFDESTVDFEYLYENREKFIGKAFAKSFDLENKKQNGVIEDVFRHLVFEYLEIEFSSGEKLEVTKEHPFFVGDRYLPVWQLKESDFVMNDDYSFDQIISIKEIKPESPVWVYNVRIAEFHNYVAGKKRVHNAKEAPV